MANATQELQCPNCGASYDLPQFGSQTRCRYCGTLIMLPQSLAQMLDPVDAQATADVLRGEKAARWIRIGLIAIIALTVLPALCSIVLSLCFTLFAFVPWFLQ